jgi:hypothetical protein
MTEQEAVAREGWLTKALCAAAAPTALMWPLSRLVVIGPCAGVVRGGAWGAAAVLALTLAGLAAYVRSVMYFVRAYPRHRFLSPALGATLSIWNGMISMFLIFMLLFAL